jgi:hypothetical protein
MILQELTHYIQNNLTFTGALPKYLPDAHIENIIENDAKPWFYRNVYESLIKEYLYIPKDAFKTEKTTQYKYVELPCDTQNVVWLYQTNDTSLFSMGVSAPNLSVNLGVTNQPYLSSSTTQIGDLGVYKVIIDGFADMLNQLTKHTLKYSFNSSSKMLNILTSTGMQPYSNTRASLIAEVYTQIPDEDLFDSPLFREYVDAKSAIALGNMLIRYDIALPGGVKMNGNAILTDGTSRLDKMLAHFEKTKPTNAMIIMTKK